MVDESRLSIADIPKVELHIHLEGAIRPTTLEELVRRSEPSFSFDDQEWARQAFRFKDLPHFLVTMRAVLDMCLRIPEDYERIAYELFTDLAEQNVRYAEVSFAPHRAGRQGISFEEMLAAINSARQRVAAERPIRVGLLVGFGRERGVKTATKFARKTADARGDGVVGVDLHGDEAIVAAPEFTEAFDIARDAGLGLRAHAGESIGPGSMWGAIQSLGVSRIAHGMRASEDLDLIEYLRSHGITLDMCPTSNYKLGLVSPLSAHPIRKFFDLGIQVTVNSDDPLPFRTNISGEYAVLRRELGFSDDELRRITLYAAEAAFLPAEEKAELKDEIERDFTVSRPC